jgi:two-component system OmpR family sensor kinase
LLSKRSIRTQFLIQLIVASAALIILFSFILFLYIQKSIYDDKRNSLIQIAQNICASQSVLDHNSQSDIISGISVELTTLKTVIEPYTVYQREKGNETYLILIYPYLDIDNSYLKITKRITPTQQLVQKIKRSIFIINILSLILIIIYAITLSKLLIHPIKALSRRLSNMNEHLISPIKVEELPEEFEPLGDTINRLIGRIQNFVKYQKELFIGAAHELKTPLAVMKLKNQVTLIKERQSEDYIAAIRKNTESVDEMNKIVSNILNIGRQEGAQLEKPTEMDVIDHLRNRANDFALLSENEKKKLTMTFEPDVFMATLQVSLLNQILQNFLQNALKFTPEGKTVQLKTEHTHEGLLIQVIDEGCGIDETMDLFAPFKRQGNKSGVGLGLFLAKSAAEASGAKIYLKNRTDDIEGTIASLHLNSKLCCPIKKK